MLLPSVNSTAEIPTAADAGETAIEIPAAADTDEIANSHSCRRR
jgi:hypothetical protein